MHRVIVGLCSADTHVAPLFEDDRWNSSRSTAPLRRWHAILRRHQIESLVEVDDVMHLSISPIWDLLELGASTDSALPMWIAWVKQEETSLGVPSVQFFKGLKTTLALGGIYGCCPLVAPSSFQKSISDLSRAEGWGQRLPSARPMYNLLCLTASEQWQMCRNLRSDQEWYALTRSGTLGSQTKALLLRTGSAITLFRRGTQAAAVKGGWRQAKLGAVKPTLNGPCGLVMGQLGQ